MNICLNLLETSIQSSRVSVVDRNCWCSSCKMAGVTRLKMNSLSLVVVTTQEELVNSVLVVSVVSTKLGTKYCDRVPPSQMLCRY